MTDEGVVILNDDVASCFNMVWGKESQWNGITANQFSKSVSEELRIFPSFCFCSASSSNSLKGHLKKYSILLLRKFSNFECTSPLKHTFTNKVHKTSTVLIPYNILLINYSILPLKIQYSVLLQLVILLDDVLSML